MRSQPLALAVFRTRSFRFQWPADLVTSLAFEMEILILGWYILVETSSVVWLTVYGALLYTGTFCAPMFGVLGDRISQKVVLAAMRAVYASLALTVLLLASTGLLTPVLAFSDPQMGERIATLRDKGLRFQSRLPRGLDPRDNAILEAPEGTPLLLMNGGD